MNLPGPDSLRKLQVFSRWMLCIAALLFPFSVAVTNIALAAAIVSGLISGLIREGLQILWLNYRGFSLALFAYIGLMATGLLWSLDLSWGIHILGRQWFWLLLPLAAASLHDPLWSRRFLLLLSIGLTLHLLFCVLQIFGWVEVIKAGSNANNPTGHIGHLSFGFVYGIWAAWLFYAGWNRQGMQRWALWLLTLWSILMTFMAQGRSGYLIILVLFLTCSWRMFSSGHRLGFRHALLALGVAGLIGAVMLTGPANERLAGTLQAPDLSSPVDFQHEAGPGKLTLASTQMHLSLWIGAFSIWKRHPLLGAGTGGFPLAAIQALKDTPGLSYGYSGPPAHPHNIYLLALTRWGPLGFLVVVCLLYNWIRLGWRRDWLQEEHGLLVSLTGIALLVHGLTSSSMEDHFSSLLAIMLLGLGIAGLYHDGGRPQKLSGTSNRVNEV